MELSGSKIKRFLIFSYITGNGNPEKNSLYFRKRDFLIFHETKTLENFIYFRK